MKNTKFRFWDSFNATFTYSDKVGKLSKFFEMYEETIIGGNNPILEQYTVLKDKNGNKISEGDILHSSESNRNYKVVSDEKTGGYNGHNSPFLLIPYHFWMCKVIGNIHQNPDLLK